ncbi:hypothetical protein C7212DRAFT_344320 [Tuber magnatum]|uniref:Uncharacterized protein n=1 Tax=Tuber magnatum TaxID=42249 RepID=A0A317SNC9_9PEZI|nr:hypothetical protein C7212DRAFT_344320 [Tuber magnatum]
MEEKVSDLLRKEIETAEEELAEEREKVEVRERKVVAPEVVAAVVGEEKREVVAERPATMTEVIKSLAEAKRKMAVVDERVVVAEKVAATAEKEKIEVVVRAVSVIEVERIGLKEIEMRMRKVLDEGGEEILALQRLCIELEESAKLVGGKRVAEDFSSSMG